MKKKIEPKIIVNEVQSTVTFEEKKNIAKLDVDLGRVDLNQMRDKINELIDKLND